MNLSSLGPRYLMRWNFRQSGRIDQDVVTTHHRLGELSLFFDEGLADLIDRYPKNAIVVETGQGVGEDRRLGTVENASGQQVMKMLRQGNFSIILRDVAQHSRPLRRVLIRLNQEMTECSESMRIRTFGGDLHLTSPGAQSPLRCDTDPTVRWQIGGNQMILNYPADILDPYQHVQRVLQEDRDAAYRTPLNYAPSMEDCVWQSAVQAGLMQSMPQATPHRVIQDDQIGVTLITRYQTQSSINHDDVLLSNHWLRRFETFSPSGNPAGRHKFARRTIAAFVRRKAKQQTQPVEEDSFTLDSPTDVDRSPTNTVAANENTFLETPTSGQPQLTH